MRKNDKRLEELFVEAVTENNLEKVRACITLGIDVNVMFNPNDCALHVAMDWAIGGQWEMFELFLTQPNIDVNMTDWDGETALMLASASGAENVVQRLSQVPGLDFNARSNDGWTAAFQAVANRELECVKVLSAIPGVNWNIKENHGWSPMASALNNGFVEILKILLTIQSIDFGITDGQNRSIAQIAVEGSGRNRNDYMEDSLLCLELLSRESRVNWNVRNGNGETPIMYTWKNRKSEMFKILAKIPTIDMDSFMQDSFNTAPECPVCFEKFTRNDNIFQCIQGHFVCERCYEQIQNCPKCRGQMIGRAHDFEQFFQTLHI